MKYGLGKMLKLGRLWLLFTALLCKVCCYSSCYVACVTYMQWQASYIVSTATQGAWVRFCIDLLPFGRSAHELIYAAYMPGNGAKLETL